MCSVKAQRKTSCALPYCLLPSRDASCISGLENATHAEKNGLEKSISKILGTLKPPGWRVGPLYGAARAGIMDTYT
jgi:hypothetical protein